MTGVKVHPEVVGLKRGTKQKWLRINRGLVKDYYFKHGPDATMQYFNLRQSTLERFLSPGRENRDVRNNKWSQSDKEVYQVVMEGQREIKRRVRELEDWRENEAEPVLAAGRALLTLNGVQLQSGKIEAGEKAARLPYYGKKLEK